MVVEAALTGFLRTLLIIGVVWFVVRLVRQLMQQKRANQAMYTQMKREQDHYGRKQRTVHDDGKTRVEYVPKDRHGNPLQSDGEYVDFEEVE